MIKEKEKIKNILESPTRELTGVWKIVVTCVAVTMSLIFIYTAGFGTFGALIQRTLFLLFSLFLIFILYPFNSQQKSKVRILDIVLVILSILAFGWILIDYQRIIWRLAYVDTLKPFDYIFGILAIVLILEANRRTMGWPLVMVTLGALVFNFIGPYIPGAFTHSGCTLEFFINHVYLTTEGLFSNIAGIASTYIIIFIAFGAFMDVSGMGKFLLDFCNALTGKHVGGTAKTAVLSSAMLGSISGSGVANVVTTGTFTIPLMKKTGYSPEEAGGVEAAASCGGQMLPPVMGAGAFVMAEFTGIPYADIVKVSIIPALLYFGLVFLFVDLMAKKKGLKGFSLDKIPPLGKTLKMGGHLLIPVIVLVFLILKGYTPFYAAFISIIIVILVGFFRKNARINLSKSFIALELAAKRTVSMASAAGCAGLILGVVSQTGVGVRMSSLILSISQGNLFLTILMVAVVAYILGMGLTVVTAYIICSVLAAPALVHLGVPLLVAHLMVFWLSQTSNISPPVCLAAYAGAAISGGDPMKTGFKSLKISSGMILIPILFAYTPIIFFSYQTNLVSFIWYVLTIALSFVLYTITLEGYATQNITIVGRILFGFAAIALYLPFAFSKIIGLGIFILSLIFYKKLTYQPVTNKLYSVE